MEKCYDGTECTGNKEICGMACPAKEMEQPQKQPENKFPKK